MDVDILKEVYDHVSGGGKIGLVILRGNQNSAPGKEGSMMAVKEDGSIIGTIGGGKLEYQVIEDTKKTLEENGKDFEFDYDLSNKGVINMACGGTTKGVVKMFYPKNQLIIFGAGHVSQRLARIAIRTGFDVVVVDDRSDLKGSKDFEGISDYIEKEPTDAIEDLEFSKDHTYIVVCTRGHALDKEAAQAVINKDYKYLGVIGSRVKVTKLYKDLEEAGYDKEKLDQIYMPMGLDIDDGSIEEIAISIMSEILAVKNNKDQVKHNKIF